MIYHQGNICRPPAQAIAHQCNAVTYGRGMAKGVASVIFRAFSYADLYAQRARERKLCVEPGSVHVGRLASITPMTPCVFNLVAQIRPGGPREFGDSDEKRQVWMKECLLKTYGHCKHLNIESLAIPYGCGCGLAGGKWPEYKKIFEEFENYSGIDVSVVVLPDFIHLITDETIN